MSVVVYKVIKTDCFPNSWFGGPTFNGRILSNDPYYYFQFKDDAQKFCDKRNQANASV